MQKGGVGVPPFCFACYIRPVRVLIASAAAALSSKKTPYNFKGAYFLNLSCRQFAKASFSWIRLLLWLQLKLANSCD